MFNCISCPPPLKVDGEAAPPTGYTIPGGVEGASVAQSVPIAIPNFGGRQHNTRRKNRDGQVTRGLLLGWGERGMGVS